MRSEESRREGWFCILLGVSLSLWGQSPLLAEDSKTAAEGMEKVGNPGDDSWHLKLSEEEGAFFRGLYEKFSSLQPSASVTGALLRNMGSSRAYVSSGWQVGLGLAAALPTSGSSAFRFAVGAGYLFSWFHDTLEATPSFESRPEVRLQRADWLLFTRVTWRAWENWSLMAQAGPAIQHCSMTITSHQTHPADDYFARYSVGYQALIAVRRVSGLEGAKFHPEVFQSWEEGRKITTHQLNYDGQYAQINPTVLAYGISLNYQL